MSPHSASLYALFAAVDTCQSEKTFNTTPMRQSRTPTACRHEYFARRKMHARSAQQGMEKQSSNIALVIDVFEYARTMRKFASRSMKAISKYFHHETAVS